MVEDGSFALFSVMFKSIVLVGEQVAYKLICDVHFV